jgi:acetylornithine deacetylase
VNPLEQTLGRLVAFPTVSDRPVDGIAAYLADRCESAGLRVERLDAPEPGKCNLVCTAGPVGTDGIILSGHMDVVPVEGQPWSTDPFQLTRRDGKLYGRGSCDMKAFIAATVEALDHLDLKSLNRELMLIWTYDEEVGCVGSRRVAERFVADGRPVPRLALIGEPTSFRMLRMHPGHAAARILCMGRAAHSSKPDLGANAIRLAARVIEILDALAEEWRTDVRFTGMLERPFVVMNVAMIRGGTAINIVPDSCVIDVGFRPLPGMDPAALFETLRERVESLGSVRAELGHVTPALLTPAGTSLENVLRPLAADHALGAASFATDGGNLAAAGVNSLIFGPGSIDVAHRADEFVPVGELHRTVDVVREVVTRCCIDAN